jgi:hypothetical protein
VPAEDAEVFSDYLLTVAALPAECRRITVEFA